MVEFGAQTRLTKYGLEMEFLAHGLRLMEHSKRSQLEPTAESGLLTLQIKSGLTLE